MKALILYWMTTPRNLVFVSDAVDAIMLMLERGMNKGVTVVGGEEIHTATLAEVRHRQ